VSVWRRIEPRRIKRAMLHLLAALNRDGLRGFGEDTATSLILFIVG
jgi:hypothetical protein